ncbi:aminoglycoside 6-adenylyltransferase [Metabacillus lacus]|uniref:aminoglycoside 6-adenylyltransferase n=1 Tax=Metabacillus lacus TaxID=1983721 RepID=UPI0031B5E38C
MGKYLKDYLPDSYWEMYENTYSDHNYEHFWDSIFITCELFRTLAKEVADSFLLPCPTRDNTNMSIFLKHVIAF